MEKWLPVKGYEGCYEVSNLGNVRGLDRLNARGQMRKGGIKKQTISTCGYWTVKLHVNRKPKLVKVHRLVCEAFLENLENKPCVNHRNGIKTDNRLENLEWNTYSENSQHAVDTGLTPTVRGEDVGNSILTEDIVRNMRKLSEEGKSYGEIARMYDLYLATAVDAIRGITWKHVDSIEIVPPKHSVKLDANKVRLIRKLSAEGYTLESLAELLSVSSSCVSNVLTGRTWKQVV